MGSLADLSNADELERLVVEFSKQGVDDQTITDRLTQKGFRSPSGLTLLLSTVRTIRLRHRIFRKRSQSHPRRVPGFLTIPQIAATLNLSPYWIYHRIDNGSIVVKRDKKTKLYLFPDQPDTLTQFRQLIAGTLKKLHFS